MGTVLSNLSYEAGGPGDGTSPEKNGDLNGKIIYQWGVFKRHVVDYQCMDHILPATPRPKCLQRRRKKIC